MARIEVKSEETGDAEIGARRSTRESRDAAQTLVIEREVRAETDRLLLLRTRIMLAIVAAGTAAGAVMDLSLGRFLQHPDRQVVHFVGLFVILGLLLAIPRASRHVSARLLAFVAATTTCLLPLAISTDASPDMDKINLVAYTVITLGTAILLPWGIWAQIGLTGVVVLCVFCSNFLVVGKVALLDPAVTPAIAVAIGLSYFVALVLENNRMTLARQRHELAAERELAEQRRLRAEALARDLDAYAHTVAHDLKGPVFVISGYNDLLQSELGGEVSEEAKEWLEATGQGCEKMTEIIDELLLLASVRKTANVASEQLDMSQIVEETRKRLAASIDGSRAEIVAPGDWPQAVGHAPWVEAIWTNYISNAIKYGGSPPRVELGADRDGDGKVHFWVRDNGKGLNEEQLSKLFEEFARADPTKAKGHGLGLSIVKRIVERLGGEVRATSRVGQGSTFGFTLPVEVRKRVGDETENGAAPDRGQRPDPAGGRRHANAGGR